ncbi:MULTISPECIES: glycosyltransferase family 4 protein [Mesobacillus]|uniref:Glycosyltransferase family 4 protein n=1 Tax=Mesobacillus selenatarsenatis TaxID=388741 RepID=A0A846TJ58_9BACI|nr:MULTISPECIES: glycosyltransferase family 4 protein [Mesobacillus]NKE06819.1 glycosyltransferase family 4 protein [Mesobacillus selenatarsenatis]
MKVLHLNAGNETGGGMHHILLLLKHMKREEVILGVFEEGEMSRRAEKLGITVKLFTQSSRLDFSVVAAVSEYVNENHVDIIHTHGPRANLFGTFLKKKTSAKWVTTIHSDPRDDFMGQGTKGKVFTFLNTWSIKKADHLLAISEKFHDILHEEYKISKDKITTILNGIEFDAVSGKPYNRQQFGLNDDELVVIMVARLEKVKDHLTAFKAVKHAIDHGEKVKLLLVGDGNEKNVLVSHVEQLGLKKEILFLGHRDDVIDLYPMADLGILTSKSESFPLVLLEAARAGVPAISTDVGGVRRMIPSAEHGWVHDGGDYKGIGDSLIKAAELKKVKQLSRIGEAFREHCRSNFSIMNQVADVNKAYTKILS